jgi:hypothetical protein
MVKHRILSGFTLNTGFILAKAFNIWNMMIGRAGEKEECSAIVMQQQLKI